MAQWVTVWRAAQLVGVPRGVLQQRVREGDLELADGLVSTEALLALYPQARFEESGMLERVVQIRDEAFGRRLRERVLPSQEVLAQRLFQQSRELADAQRHLQRYHALVLSLRDRLRQLDAESGGSDPRFTDTLARLNDGLARALATEPVDMLDVMDDMLKVVSAQVTVRPSGRQFMVEGRDSLLQAGMKAGLKLAYGCGNGSCGMCKVRITDGQVARCMHSDYALSEPEKAQGYVLSCAHTAASTELTMETLEAGGPADIPLQQIVTTVRAIKPLGDDTLLLHLQTPRTHRLRFLAGQSVTLGLADGDGVRAEHAIASCPCDDRNLHVYLARREDDPLAVRAFAGALAPGAAVTVWGPHGDFVLDEAPLPLVFAADDLGFAPVKSLIEHALSLDQAPSIALYWLATRRDGHFAANQCRSWSEALDLFEYNALSHADPAVGAAQVAEAMRADLFGIDSAFYLAGSTAFVDGLRGELLAGGVPASRIRSETLP
jgi:CDP-4-dehydro-6-deoxyglucose reductase